MSSTDCGNDLNALPEAMTTCVPDFTAFAIVCAVSGAKLASERSVVSSRSSAMSFIFLSVIFITVTIIARTAQIVKLTEAANKCIIGINRAKE